MLTSGTWQSDSTWNLQCICRKNHVLKEFLLWITFYSLASINEVNQRRVRLVLRWVTVSGSIPGDEGHLSRYVTSHPGQLSLAIPSWVSAMSTDQRAVMPCGWGVKAGMVRVWVADKTVWSLVTRGQYLSALRNKELIIKRYINSPSLLYLLFTTLHGLQTRSSDENSVCPSIRLSHAWIVTKR